LVCLREFGLIEGLNFIELVICDKNFAFKNLNKIEIKLIFQLTTSNEIDWIKKLLGTDKNCQKCKQK
jgi:hypothetical protein